MMEDVDQCQDHYDSVVANFKDTIGLDDQAIENLMVGIYNKFQKEILVNAEKK